MKDNETTIIGGDRTFETSMMEQNYRTAKLFFTKTFMIFLNMPLFFMFF